MESSNQIATRFREVLLDGKWVANTNYKDLLSDVTWDQATFKIGRSNSIATLAFHINYYINGILLFFETGQLEIRDKYSFDLPEIKTKKDWEALVNELMSNAEKFASHVESMSDEELEAIFMDEKYGNYRRNIEGVIEHSYYHMGQISLIRKMVKDAENG